MISNAEAAKYGLDNRPKAVPGNRYMTMGGWVVELIKNTDSQLGLPCHLPRRYWKG